MTRPLLLGCGPADPIRTSGDYATSETTVERFKITRIGAIQDESAYGDVRVVFVIVDTKTGREFFGMSGVGVSELGAHSTGKIMIGDER